MTSFKTILFLATSLLLPSNVAMGLALRPADGPVIVKAGGPWLGIQFGPVSKPLAAHLGLDAEKGQMVLNVVEGSPADDAGLQQYDVITEIDGRSTPADVEAFLEIVRGFEPGQTHDFSLIRKGNRVQVSITIGKRPETAGLPKYKYEVQPGPFSQGKVFQRGGIVQKGPNGQWNFQPFGQLKDMPDFWRFMPHMGKNNMTFSWKGGSPKGNDLHITIQKGKKLRIERDENGRITVTKTEDENGNKKTTTTTYDNEEDFKKADPEAYNSYKGSFQFSFNGQLKPFMRFGDKGLFGGLLFNKKGNGDKKFNLHMNINPDDLKKQLEQFKDLTDQMKKQAPAPDDDLSDALVGKASVSFEVDPDGAIRVSIHRGDDELIENYDSAEQLKEARPDLYQRYQNLKQAGPKKTQ